MRKIGCLISGLLVYIITYAQDPVAQVKKAFSKLESDEQMTYGQAALYVVDASDGTIVFERNSRIGMAPASSQKVITAATALELLGPEFTYATKFWYKGSLIDGVLQGNLIVEGSGDPVLGSFRFLQTKPDVIGKNLTRSMKEAGIRQISGGVIGYCPGFETVTIPSGWIWEDIGNYYGAGHSALNWNENQYDLWLKPGKKSGDPVDILRTHPLLNGQSFNNELFTGNAGTGDNAFIYFLPGKPQLEIRGTIPCCVDSFRISGAVTDPVGFSLQQIKNLIHAKGPVEKYSGKSMIDPTLLKNLYTHHSPGLDSIVFWFLQKSVNLYGEALVHTLSQKIKGKANYDSGLNVIQDFWASKGIDKKAIHIMDGSGLSPQNRVTAESLVQVLTYARKRNWFQAFYAGFPTYNGIKMKSGTIGGAKTYTGYIKSKTGREYVFAIMVNNFSGSSSMINKKIFEVLDSLK